MKVITTHLNSDFDALASMVAAKKLYPDAVMVFPGSQEKNVRKFINEALQDQYEFTKLKQIDIDQIQTLIIVDTQRKSRIGDFARCLDTPGISIHIYDHHPDNADDITGQTTTTSLVGASTTIMCQVLQQENIPITQEEATLFGLGIYEDTGSLTHLTTTPQDLLAVAWLLNNGAQLDVISQFLSFELTARQVNLIHELTKTAKNYMISGVSIVVANLTLQDYEDDFSLVVRRFMVMENLDCFFALVCMEGRVYLIARSRIPEVNVGSIARDFNGGGHATASSATVRDMSLIEAQEKLIRSLHRHIKPQAIAKEMLTSPVISIPENITILEANTLLTRYNITALPVLAEEPEEQALYPVPSFKVLGCISRRLTEKAIHHNLGSTPVSDYMTTDIEVLTISSTLADIE